jgi:protein-arginine kinase activator protein McsA
MKLRFINIYTCHRCNKEYKADKNNHVSNLGHCPTCVSDLMEEVNPIIAKVSSAKLTTLRELNAWFKKHKKLLEVDLQIQ